MQSAPKYQCSKCSLAVLVHGENVIKACKCDAPILANMEATMKGTGGVSVGARARV